MSDKTEETGLNLVASLLTQISSTQIQQATDIAEIKATGTRTY